MQEKPFLVCIMTIVFAEKEPRLLLSVITAVFAFQKKKNILVCVMIVVFHVPKPVLLV